MTLAELYAQTAAELPSDKPRSGLWPVYEELLAPWRERPVRLLEIGVRQGGALLTYARWFSDARCFGLDLARPPRAFSFLADQLGLADRVSFFLGDQAEPPAALSDLDIVIDDAGHLYAPTRAALLALWPRLRPGGLYVVEDWQAGQWNEEKYGADGGLRALLHQCLDELANPSLLPALARVLVLPRAFALYKETSGEA